MNRFNLIACIVFLALSVVAASAQAADRYAGTVLSFGSGLNTRVVTANFELNIKGRTSPEDTQRFLGLLQEGDINELRNELGKEDLGSFSIGPRVAIPINAVFENEIDGKRRIFAVFERWTHFAEFRSGSRSTQYPFGVIELYIDPATGKGEGTYIAAAKVRWKKEGNNGQPQIDIENFGTYPARLMGVTQTGRQLR